MLLKERTRERERVMDGIECVKVRCGLNYCQKAKAKAKDIDTHTRMHTVKLHTIKL